VVQQLPRHIRGEAGGSLSGHLMQGRDSFYRQGVDFRFDLRAFFVRHVLLLHDERSALGGQAEDGEEVGLEEVAHEAILSFLAVPVVDVSLDGPLHAHDAGLGEESGGLVFRAVQERAEAFERQRVVLEPVDNGAGLRDEDIVLQVAVSVEHHHQRDDKEGHFALVGGSLGEDIGEAELFRHDDLDGLAHVNPLLVLQHGLLALLTILALGVEVLVPLVHAAEAGPRVEELELLGAGGGRGGLRIGLGWGGHTLLFDCFAALAHRRQLLFPAQAGDLAEVRLVGALPAPRHHATAVVRRFRGFRRVTRLLSRHVDVLWVRCGGERSRHLVARVAVEAVAERVVRPEGGVGVLEDALGRRTDTHGVGRAGHVWSQRREFLVLAAEGGTWSLGLLFLFLLVGDPLLSGDSLVGVEVSGFGRFGGAFDLDEGSLVEQLMGRVFAAEEGGGAQVLVLWYLEEVAEVGPRAGQRGRVLLELAVHERTVVVGVFEPRPLRLRRIDGGGVDVAGVIVKAAEARRGCVGAAVCV